MVKVTCETYQYQSCLQAGSRRLRKTRQKSQQTDPSPLLNIGRGWWWLRRSPGSSPRAMLVGQVCSVPRAHEGCGRGHGVSGHQSSPSAC